MCWIGNLSDKRIAKRDFFAYKVLVKHKKYSRDYFSPFMGERYQLGEHCVMPIPISPNPVHTNGNCRIEEGLHCYSQENKVKIYNNCYGMQILAPYADLNVKIYSSYFDTIPVIVKCIIPEGTTYYTNKNGEIVTEKMIIKEEIFLPEGSVKRFRNIK